jgi:hypothetical protein
MFGDSPSPALADVELVKRFVVSAIEHSDGRIPGVRHSQAISTRLTMALTIVRKLGISQSDLEEIVAYSEMDLAYKGHALTPID